MLAESFVTLYRASFPSCYGQSLRAACAAIGDETGRGSSVTVDLLGRWRAGSLPIPEDVADVMRAAVVLAWPGSFDRGGLLDAIALPDPEIRRAKKAKRNAKKALATILQHS